MYERIVPPTMAVGGGASANLASGAARAVSKSINTHSHQHVKDGAATPANVRDAFAGIYTLRALSRALGDEIKAIGCATDALRGREFVQMKAHQLVAKCERLALVAAQLRKTGTEERASNTAGLADNLEALSERLSTERSIVDGRIEKQQRFASELFTVYLADGGDQRLPIDQMAKELIGPARQLLRYFSDDLERTTPSNNPYERRLHKIAANFAASHAQKILREVASERRTAKTMNQLVAEKQRDAQLLSQVKGYLR